MTFIPEQHLADRHPLVVRLFRYLSANPSQIAYHLIQDENHQKMTCEEILQKSLVVATYLQKNREKTFSKSLLVFDPGIEFISTFLGCLLANVVATPIALSKPRTNELFQHFLQQLKPDYLLTTSELNQRIRQLLPSGQPLEFQMAEIDRLPTDQIALEILTTPQDIALIQYTSGTTSHPKGVTITFDNLFENLAAIQQHFGLNEKSTTFSWLPHYHDMGLVDGLLSPLFNQCTGILTTPYHVVRSPISWLKAIDAFQVTHTGGPNFILDLCVDRIPKDEAIQLNLRSLSHLYVSAEPVRKKTLDRFVDHFKEAGFRSHFFTPGYGLAEATLMVSCKKPGDELKNFRSGNPGKEVVYVGLGNTIPKLRLEIINPKTFETLRDGEIGEIVISGPTIMKGYYNDEHYNRQAFIQLTGAKSEEKFLRTGDLGFRNVGELVVTGRIKDTLIFFGVQYQAEDLEYPISQASTFFVKSGCAAFCIDVNEMEQLIILQEVKRDSFDSIKTGREKELIQDTLFNFFGLKAYDIVLVKQGDIPKTTSGKIRRAECKNLYIRGHFNSF